MLGRARWSSALLLLLLPLSAHPSTRNIENSELKFGFALPDGFEPSPPSGGGPLYTFTRELSDGARLLVSVDRMGGTIGREKLEVPQNVAIQGAPAARTSVEETTWRGFLVSVLHTETQQEGVELLVLQAQLPLIPEAVSVTVASAKSHEPEIRALLSSVVDSVHGRTNWLTTQQRVEKAVRAAVSMVLGLGIVWLLWRRRRARKVT